MWRGLPIPALSVYIIGVSAVREKNVKDIHRMVRTVSERLGVLGLAVLLGVACGCDKGGSKPIG